MKSSLSSEIIRDNRISAGKNSRRWASAVLAVTLSAAAAFTLPPTGLPGGYGYAAAAQQRVISTGTPTAGNAGRSTQGQTSVRPGQTQGTQGSAQGVISTGQAGSSANTAGTPSAAELERLQGFASTLEEQGIGSSPRRQTGSTASGGYVSTGTPTGRTQQSAGSSQGTVVVQGASDPRLESMSSAMQSWEAEHGPQVQDVVVETRRPWQEADSAYQDADPAGNTQYLPLDESVLASGWESTDSTSGSIHGSAQNSTEISGGLNLFPTTDWRQFGTELVSLGTYTLTAYDPCLACCGKTDGITATGSKGMAGRTIAVDPEVIPYGSLVVIGGYVFIAEDAGEAIKGNHIDLFMDTHEVAKQFGVREAEVFLIR